MFSITKLFKVFFLIFKNTFWGAFLFLDSRLKVILKAQKNHIRRCGFLWWLHSESNQGHVDFQSTALPTELWSHGTSGDDLLSHRASPAVSWAPWGLTVVFGMGTGVTLRDIDTRYSVFERSVSFKTAYRDCKEFKLFFFWLSPRSISMSKLNTLLHLHLSPINLVFFKGSYWLTSWEILS